ncbi:hypothetical protein C6A85_000000104645 [Mycobacterium sp. ITM-2017-0098]|nr:hypothetical protein C6A85_000000104645 [Mycobacterium sp. ITM-2017-0098]
MKAISGVSTSFVAYVFLLLGFVALGTFVYALATESYLTAAIGAVLVIMFALAVVGFRAGARNRAESNESGIAIDGANVWAKPLRRAQINQYLVNYRRDDVIPELADDAGVATPEMHRQAA